MLKQAVAHATYVGGTGSIPKPPRSPSPTLGAVIRSWNISVLRSGSWGFPALALVSAVTATVVLATSSYPTAASVAGVVAIAVSAGWLARSLARDIATPALALYDRGIWFRLRSPSQIVLYSDIERYWRTDYSRGDPRPWRNESCFYFLTSYGDGLAIDGQISHYADAAREIVARLGPGAVEGRSVPGWPD